MLTARVSSRFPISACFACWLAGDLHFVIPEEFVKGSCNLALCCKLLLLVKSQNPQRFLSVHKDQRSAEKKNMGGRRLVHPH